MGKIKLLRKAFIALLAFTAACATVAGVSACAKKTDGETINPSITVSEAYAQATDYGYKDTIEAFTAKTAVSSGLSISEVRLNSKNELIVTLNDGTVINLGVVELSCNHEYGDFSESLAPTCVSIGYSVRECALCGEKDYSILPAKGHRIENFTHNQSCHAGLCSDCGFVEEEHSFTENTCTVCGYQADYTLGLGYQFNSETQSFTVIRTTDYADRNLREATEIVVPSIYKNYPVTEIGEKAFYLCRNEKIVLPDGITKIGAAAFKSNTLLKSVNIPSGVTEIGERAFSACINLEEINLPDGLNAIGDRAFEACRKITSVTIPENITALGVSVFTASGLESIEIPESVTNIGLMAFSNCRSLKSVKLPSSVTVLTETFKGCTALESIELPDSITEIGENTFNGCSRLKNIKLPANLKVIGASAFAYCSGIESIVLPDSVSDLADGAFLRCKNLKSVTLPAGLIVVSEYAFGGCVSLSEVIVPESMELIRQRAFINCGNLKIINFAGTAAQWKAIQKESGWKTDDNIITDLTVVCSDGELEYIW